MLIAIGLLIAIVLLSLGAPLWTPLDNLTFGAAGGVTRTFDMQNTHLCRAIALELTATVTNPGGGSTIMEDALSKIFGFNFYVGSAPDLAVNGREYRHYLDIIKGVSLGYTEIVGTAGAQVGTWNLVIPFSDAENPEFPDTTAADLRLGDNPRLELLIGAIGAITATGGASLDSGTMAAYADLIEIAADVPRARATTIRHIKSITASNNPTSATRSRIRQDYGEIVRRILYMVRNTATPFARSNARVTRLEQVINGLERGAVSWASHQARASEQFNIAMPTGVTVAEFDPAERLDPRMMLDLRGASRAELAIDTDGTAADVVMLQEQILLPTVADLSALGVE